MSATEAAVNVGKKGSKKAVASTEKAIPSRNKFAVGEERQFRVVMVGTNNKIVAQTKTLRSRQPEDEAGNKRIINYQRRALIEKHTKEIQEAGGLDHVKFEMRPPLATEAATA